MATRIKPGGINHFVREIEKADSIQVAQLGAHSVLYVIEEGDTRALEISRHVAEVLIAWGISYGS